MEPNPYQPPNAPAETGPQPPELAKLIYREQKPRSIYGCALALFLVVLTGGFGLATASAFLQGGWTVVFIVPFGLIVAILVFFVFAWSYGFLRNDVWQFGIRDDRLWWYSPFWPHSEGSIPLETVCKVKVREGPSRLEVTMRDGSNHRIPCLGAARAVRDVLVAHYPAVAIEFIEDSG